MKIYVLHALVLAVAIYAWRDWFLSLCVLIVLTALSKHPEMPPSLAGVMGLNLLNLLLVDVALAWGVSRYVNPPPRRAVPRFIAYTVGAYALVVAVTAVRGFLGFDDIRLSSPMAVTMTRGAFLLDFLGNPIKHLFIAFLLFDGMRNRRNILLGMAAIVCQVVFFSLMAVRYVPPEALLQPGSGSQLESAFRHRFQKQIGFHPNDLALALVAGFWSLMAVAPLLWRMGKRYRAAILTAAPLIAVAIALTNSRAGYMAMVALGLLFGLVRWRWLLAGIPLAALLIFFTVPAVQTRLQLGFGAMDPTGQQANDLDEITAGRWAALWPPTVEEIAGSPIFGQGRMTIMRTSLYDRICALNEGECPSHPHNAYLEVLLDSGVVGLAPVLGLFAGLPVYMYRRRRRDIPLLDAAACVGLAGAGTILVMGMTGQTFWPREAVDLVLLTNALALGAHVLGRQVPVALPWPQRSITSVPARAAVAMAASAGDGAGE
jgi:O-antigen ligase